jgi:3-oxoacyl-[acyl-carrier protein] reductase
MISLDNRVCLITGAGRGIGRGIAEGFVRRGARVVATDRELPQLETAALNLAWDVADAAQAEDAINATVEKFGRLDAFVANAGVYPRQPWNEITPDNWRRILNINLDGAWFGAQAAARVMQKQGYGKIVLVTSIEVVFGPDAHVHYTTAKAALIGLTRSLARALGPSGVRVNAVMPGAVSTEGEREQFPDEEAVAAAVAKQQCLPQRLEPEGIEPSFAFLCSEESDAITGQVLCVDHGLVHY